MNFEWDIEKDRLNQTKHGVSFQTASRVFDDPRALSRLERVVDQEERWQTLGMIGGVVVLLVAHTWHGESSEEKIRIISARKATRRERRAYEEGRFDE